MNYKYEDEFQKDAAKLLDFYFGKNYKWCHIANERITSPKNGAMLKQKGVKKGVPDCLVFAPNDYYVGLAIELKIKNRKASDEQKKWLQSLSDINWKTEIVNNKKQLIKIIKEYYSTVNIKYLH